MLKYKTYQFDYNKALKLENVFLLKSLFESNSGFLYYSAGVIEI